MAVFKIEAADGRDVLRMHNLQSLGVTAVWVVPALVIAALARRGDPILAAAMFGAAVAWATSWAISIRHFGSRYRWLCRRYSDPITAIIEPESLHLETEYGSRLIKRKMIERVRVRPDTLVVELLTREFVVLPRRHLSDQEFATIEGWKKSE